MRLLLASIALVLLTPATARADLVISEIAANPSLPEPPAEFVVVDNTGSDTVVMDGMRLTDAARVVRGVVPPDTSLDPGQRIALQPSAGADAYSCSPVPHRALLTAWAQLNNTGDSVVLEAPDGRVLDRVAYDADAFAVEGPSRVLDRSSGRWSPSAGEATPCALPPPRPGRFRFATAEVSAAENAPAATLEVLRSGGTNGRVVVCWRALDASATRGSDFPVDSGTVTFAAGQQRTSLSVPLLDDSRDEPDETFTVALGGVELAEPARAVVRVLDDDPPAPPVLTPVLPGTGTPATPAGGGAAPAVPGAGGAATAPVGGPSASPAASQSAASPAAPPPRASLGVAAWQRVLRRGGLTAVVACDSDCDVELSGRIALGGGRSARLAPAARHLHPGVPTIVILRLPRHAARAVRRVLKRRGSLLASLRATPAGGLPAERRVRVRR